MPTKTPSPEPLIETYGAIAAHLSRRLRRDISANQVRKWSNRRFDPLPLHIFAGLVGADAAELEAWCARQVGVRMGQRSVAKAA